TRKQLALHIDGILSAELHERLLIELSALSRRISQPTCAEPVKRPGLAMQDIRRHRLQPLSQGLPPTALDQRSCMRVDRLHQQRPIGDVTQNADCILQLSRLLEEDGGRALKAFHVLALEGTADART